MIACRLRQLRRAAFVVATLALVAVLVAPPSEDTEGSWVDRVDVNGSFAAGRWATTGAASGDVLTARLANTLLVIPLVVGPIGPQQRSDASPASPGPNALGPTNLGVPGLDLAVATATVTASTASTSASYTMLQAAGSAQVKEVKAGVTVLGVIGALSGLNALLANLLVIGTSSGFLGATAGCVVGQSATATTVPATSSLAVTLLNQSVPLVNGTAQLTVPLPGLLGPLASITASLAVTPTTVASTAPADPAADAKVTAVVDLVVTPVNGLLGSIELSLSIVLVHASCQLVVP